MRTRWVEVVGWDEFQHYQKRQPIWIKNYVALLVKDEYRQLTGHQRGVLHGLWLVYASSSCQVRADSRSLSRQLGLRITSAQLEALSDAGFIRIRASKPLANRKQAAMPETEPSKEGSVKEATRSPLESGESPNGEIERDPEAAAKAKALMNEVFGNA